MLWHYTTYFFVAVILIWTYLDFRDLAEHPYRAWLWFFPVLSVLWVAYLWWHNL